LSNRFSHNQPSDIAIVGMAGCYAGARSARHFWQNIVNKVDAVSAADADWTGPYLDAESRSNDRIYTNKGGFLHDLAEFNPVEFGIMPAAVDGGEPDHYLALRLARDALADAGYTNGGYDPERAGVILGRGTYINRGYTTLMQHGMAVDQTLAALKAARPDLTADDLDAIRVALKKQLPAFNAEMSPGLVPNVTTGIIANRLNLMGPNYIIDAACASSLISVELAARELMSGRCDMVLAGGVQAHTPPQLFMIFCQIGALSRGNIRPFDKSAGGTLLGEGAGLLVLKRLADAEAAGDRIYAVIKGMGTSSDGRAKGLLAPRREGEVLALKRAYESAGIDPTTVGLVEAHGTGIALGDQTEVESLTEIYGERRGHAPRVALGSVKSMISHCIPAAGSAAMIKTALALHHKVLPPTLCDEINPDLNLERTPFYINTETRPWVHGLDTPRRAGVNAFGFGGINAHVILEEHVPTRRTQVPVSWHAPSDGELFVLSAPDRAALIARVHAVLARIEAQPLPEFAALARYLAEHCEAGSCRLACVAADHGALAKHLRSALARLEKGETAFRTRGGLCYGEGDAPGKLAFVFPGEGAQYPGMLNDLAVAFPQVREWFDFLDRTFGDSRGYRPSEAMFPPPNGLSTEQAEAISKPLFDMDLASESVFTASQGLYDLLQLVGVSPDAMLGHSTGENTALVASGRLRSASAADDGFEGRAGLSRIAHDLNTIYRQLEADGAIHTGSLLTVGALDAETRARVLAPFGDRIIIAMDNCPNQVVVFGQPDDIHAAHEAFTAEGGVCAELPFGRAYHTPLFEPVARAFRDFYEGVEMGPGPVPLYSCSTVDVFPDEAGAIRDTACGQWARPVRFAETVQRMYDDGVRVFLEVGPSANLSAFVGDALRGHEDLVAIATNSRRQPDVKHFLSALAQLHALGVPMQPAALFAHRETGEATLALPTETAKKVPVLNLHLPALTLDISSLPALPKAAAAESTAPTPEASQAPAMPVTPAAPADPRVQAVKAHFELMQAFLDSQMRVLGGVSAAQVQAPASPPPVVAAAAPTPRPQPAPRRHDLDTDSAFPLLGTVMEESDNRLVMERTYRLHQDLFLGDHTIGGEPSAHDSSLRPIPVIPFTFSMEILAEASSRLVGQGLRFVGMNVARGHRWLSLDDDTLTARIVVERAPGAREVSGRIFLKQPGGLKTGVLVFEGTACFADAYETPPAPMPWTAEESWPATQNPDGELYAHGMFHGPRLQGVKHIRRWADDAIEADLEVIPTHDYFAHTRTPRFQLDPALLDAAGQLAGYWLTEKHTWGFNCFPFRLGKFRQFAPPPAAGSRVLCRGILRMTDEHLLEAHFDLISADGTLLARAEAWEDRKFSVPKRLYQYRLAPTERFLSKPWLEGRTGEVVVRRMEAFDEHFLDEGWGIWKRMLGHMALNHAERTRFYGLPSTGPRREEWLMGRVAAKEAARTWIAREYGLRVANADIEIIDNAQGKPSLRCAMLGDRPAPVVSLAHSRRWAAAAVAAPGQAIGWDYQRIERIKAEDVEKGALTAAESAQLEGLSGAPRLQRVVAMWCAKEAAAKLSGLGLGGRPDAWEVTFSAAREDGALPAHVRHGDQAFDLHVLIEGDAEVAALCLMPEPSGTTIATAEAVDHPSEAPVGPRSATRNPS
jgi:acyl transferase domain-containing protein/phosphopantetheinyl transferase